MALPLSQWARAARSTLRVPFTKMEGLGNSYVFVHCNTPELRRDLRIDAVPDSVCPSSASSSAADHSVLARLARYASDPNWGIGSDGLILIIPPLDDDAAAGGGGGGGGGGVAGVAGVAFGDPSDDAADYRHAPDCEMRIYNSDGSAAEMCGNGLRCVASFISSRGLRHPRRARGGDHPARGGDADAESDADAGGDVWVQTGAGLRRCGILPDGDVRVSLGTPQILDVASPLAVPTPSALLLQRWSSTEPGDAEVGAGAGAGAGVAAFREFPVTGISVGNPHCVVFEDDFAEEEKEEEEKEEGGKEVVEHAGGEYATAEGPVGGAGHGGIETGEPCAAGGDAATTRRKRKRRERTNGKSSMPIENLPLWGPQLEWHEAFPDGVNTEFVRILDAGNFEMRTWERGSGETLACGTGAGAAAAACMLTGRTALRSLTAHLRGGQLRIDWEEHSEGGGGGVGGGGGGVEGVGGAEGTLGGTAGGSRAVAAVEAGRGELFIQGPAREICSGELLFPLLADS